MGAIRDRADLQRKHPVSARQHILALRRTQPRNLSIDLYTLQCAVLEAVARGDSIEQTAELLCRHVERLSPGLVCSLLLIEDGCLYPLSAASLPAEFVETIRGVPIGPMIGSCGSSAFLGVEVDVPDIDTDPRWQPYKQMPLAAGLMACWSTPITARDGRVIGTFALYFRTARSPSRRERRIVSSCMHLCALVIERQNALGALSRTNRVLDTTLEKMSQGLCLFDRNGVLKVVNRRFLQIYGLPLDGLRPGMELPELIERLLPACRETLSLDQLIRVWRGIFMAGEDRQYFVQLRNGRVLSILAQLVDEDTWMCTYDDVTEHRETEERLTHITRHDMLTDLPNRILFHEELEVAVANTAIAAPCALLTINLDRFKSINDGLGYHTGDALLAGIAARLRHCVEPCGLVCRLGGDEFAILLTDGADPATAGAVATKVLAEIARPFVVEGHTINISASIGIAVAPCDATTAESLLRHSDIALNHAKNERPGAYRFYDPPMSQSLDERRTLELDLRHALERDELALFFQPVFGLKRGRISSFEALLRWNHPRRGMIMPSVFIPIAEETGLINAIGAWAIREACMAAVQWPSDIKVSVNLSAAQFDDDLLSVIHGALNASGLPPQRLDIEITESVLLDDDHETLSILKMLQRLGAQVSIDDFGTGYSSLSYLNRFPLDRIKIDRSFVRDLPTGREALAIVRAVVGLGKTLGMFTTAEGVETEEQLALLHAEGCDEVQGYLFGRPSPVEAIPALIVANARRLAG